MSDRHWGPVIMVAICSAVLGALVAWVVCEPDAYCRGFGHAREQMCDDSGVAACRCIVDGEWTIIRR